MGVVHRYLMPYNFFIDCVDVDAPLKIADFGIARVAEGTKLTGTNRIIGTPAYMSPEQASAGAIDGRTDLYTTGVILYELITGRNPFTGDSPMATLGNVINGNVRPVGDVEPATAFVVDVVVARLLSLRADDRYATATDVLAALAPVLERAAALRTHWTALVGGAPGAGAAAVVDEAGGWARAARKEMAVADRAAAAAYAAFRATSLDPDQRDARAVLTALEGRGQRFTFTRSISPARQADEQRAESVPLDERRAIFRSLGDASFADGNPRFASQWWRRSIKVFGPDEADLSRLARVTGADELREVETLSERAEGHRSQAATQNGRAWKPASQAASTSNSPTTTNAANANANANESGLPLPTARLGERPRPASRESAWGGGRGERSSTTMPEEPTSPGAPKKLPAWAVPVLVVVGLIVAFAAGMLAQGHG